MWTGQPWSNGQCTFDKIRSEVLAAIANYVAVRKAPFTVTNLRLGTDIIVDEDGNLATQEDKQRFPDWGKTLLHDERYVGAPMHYSVRSDAFTMHLLGCSFLPSQFHVGDFTHARLLSGEPDNSNKLWVKHNSVRDPPIIENPVACFASSAISTFVGKATMQVHSTPPVISCATAGQGTSVSDMLYVPPAPASPPADSERVEDVVVANPGGRLDIFYQLPDDPNDWDQCRHRRSLAELGPQPYRTANGGVIQLRPAVDRAPELLDWLEQRAAAYGLSPPYLQPGFVPASVSPQHLQAPSASASSSSNAAPDAMLEEGLGMPPLAAVHAEAGGCLNNDVEYPEDEEAEIDDEGQCPF